MEERLRICLAVGQVDSVEPDIPEGHGIAIAIAIRSWFDGNPCLIGDHHAYGPTAQRPNGPWAQRPGVPV